MSLDFSTAEETQRKNDTPGGEQLAELLRFRLGELRDRMLSFCGPAGGKDQQRLRLDDRPSQKNDSPHPKCRFQVGPEKEAQRKKPDDVTEFGIICTLLLLTT
jgi:hypothetical protein